MEKKTTYIIFILVLCLACFSAWDLFSRNSKGTNGNNALDTVQELSGDNTKAGGEVDNARQQISDASANTAGVITRVERSEDIVNQNSTTIAECRELARQCLELNRQAKSILNDIEQGNQSGTQTSKD